MMSEFGKFYNPSEMDLSKIVRPYQKAFEGLPWNEVSKCVDNQLPMRCAGELSATAINAMCGTCGLSPKTEAYAANELVERFTQLAATRPMLWYIEEVEGGVALAAEAWVATAEQVGSEKYSDVPAMQEELVAMFGDTSIIWLDEVFADKTVRPNRNLDNFGAMNKGFMERLGIATVAYRTIAPEMMRSATRDFEQNATILEQQNGIPDRRNFVVIEGSEL
jgi:hypothetical protein